MAEQVAEIASRIKRQLSDFDQDYKQALVNRNSGQSEIAKAFVGAAQQKVGRIWEDWQRLEGSEPKNAQDAKDARSAGAELTLRLKQLDELERKTDLSTSTSGSDPRNWATWLGPFGRTRSETQAKIDEVDAYAKKVGNR